MWESKETHPNHFEQCVVHIKIILVSFMLSNGKCYCLTNARLTNILHEYENITFDSCTKWCDITLKWIFLVKPNLHTYETIFNRKYLSPSINTSPKCYSLLSSDCSFFNAMSLMFALHVINEFPVLLITLNQSIWYRVFIIIFS